MFPGYPSMSGSGKIVGALRQSPAAKAVVAEGWASLLAAMDAGQINTPRRQAAFLTTLAFESWCEYNVHQLSDTRTYAGRGYIQLTGVTNYEDAGNDLGVDLTNDPEAARSLNWSARIATWYWTKARPKCNAYADLLQMGRVCGAIGYPLAGSNDADRCMVFAKALEYLTGVPTVGVETSRS